jgi:NADH dehydrogenase FAD-containing subunit
MTEKRKVREKKPVYALMVVMEGKLSNKLAARLLKNPKLAYPTDPIKFTVGDEIVSFVFTEGYIIPAVAQVAEQGPYKAKTAGSTPASRTKFRKEKHDVKHI